MSAILEVIGGIIAFIVELLFHALRFGVYGLCLAFSPRHRQELRNRWTSSRGQRFMVVTEGILGVGLLVFAVWILGGLIWRKPAPRREATQPAPVISKEEISRLVNSAKEKEGLTETAKEILRERLARRREAKEAADPPSSD